MTIVEVVPHPKIRGHWLVKSQKLLPYPIRFTNKQDATNYAEWVGRDRSFEIVIREPAVSPRSG
jgi:hypothetical protein